MWRNLIFSISVMWRNYRLLHMIDVEKSEIYPHLSCGEISYFSTDVGNSEITHHVENFLNLFRTQMFFFVIYTILLRIRFVAIYSLLYIYNSE